ncbi:MAG: Ig-like domain-containing protein, partial [Chloroflexota bacterium]|nr:Ig-like domain-containing protein [Chloroflexota bacterium]
ALNNSTSTTQTVSLGGTFKHLKGTQNPTLNNGAQVTSVTIPEHDGVILLRVGDSGSTISVASTTPANGATVSGAVPWTATASGGTIAKVDFLIDGALRWTEKQAPYDFNGDGGKWDTTKETAGAHSLQVRAIATDGRTATSTITVTVADRGAGAVSISSPSNGATVTGKVPWSATTSGFTPAKVEFLVDGALRWTEKYAPYTFNGDGGTWDTTKETDGSHKLTVRAIAADGRSSTSSIAVTVSNFRVAIVSPVAGASVSGTVRWEAVPSGASVERVDFYVDGILRTTERNAPYVYGETSGLWNTARETNGSHTLLARAYATDGRSVRAEISVVVKN